MVIGDPLLHVQRPVTPPGVIHPNPVHVFVRQALTIIGIIALTLAIVAWFWAVSPDDDWCQAEDAPCIPAG